MIIGDNHMEGNITSATGIEAINLADFNVLPTKRVLAVS